MEQGEFESSPEHLYFLAIEETFLELRGSPLSLSSKDWQVARRWHESGIPLELVERTLREIFERRRTKGTQDKLTSLAFCRRSVEAAWKRQETLRAPGVDEAAPSLGLDARLVALASALPEHLAGRDGVAERIRELEGDPEVVEERLRALDAQLLRAAEEGLGDAARRELEDQLARAVRNLERRLPAAEVEGAGELLRERLLRERVGLPVLSLFAPEAAPE